MGTARAVVPEGVLVQSLLVGDQLLQIEKLLFGFSSVSLFIDGFFLNFV